MMERKVSMFAVALALGACDRPTSPAPPTPSASTNAPMAMQASSTTATSSASTVRIATVAPDAAAPPIVSFDTEKPGEPSRDFEGVIGDWYVAEENGAKGLKVDGGKWRNGEASVGLADQAKHLYGDHYAEFLDGVKAFAFFPFAVWKGDAPTGAVRISVRFFPEAGKVDQAAGIIFGITPEGTYWGVRANALEDNLLFFKVVKGKRTVFDTVRDVPTASKTWHTLVVELAGKRLTASLDGQKRFEKTLEFVPSGRVGVWSKADSQVLFDDFTIVPLGGG